MDIEIKQRYTFIRKYGWIMAVGAALAGLIVWALLTMGRTTYDASGETLLIEEVREGEFNDFIRLTGKVETGTVVQVSALESGIVEKKWIEEGAMVNEGDIILTLHNPLLRQQILDSESHLAEKQNMLRDTEIAMEKEQLQVKKDLLQTKTELLRKQREADRCDQLWKEGLVSREEWLTAREDLKLAEESYKLLRDRLHQDSLYRGTQLAMMRESLRNMMENFSLVSQRADNLNVRASHSGQLGSLNAELGQNIASGQQVGQINILDNYKLTVLVDEHYIDRITTGLNGKASRSGRSFDVEVRKVYPEVNNGQFKADLTVKDPGGVNLRVGQSYPVDLRLGENTRAVLLPKGTFYQHTGGKWVYVVDPDGTVARKREIEIGRQNPVYYEVVKGLNPGEKVVTGSYKTFGDAGEVRVK